MNHSIQLLFATAAIALLPGCRSAEQKQAAREAKLAEQEARAREQMHANVPADSPLQKVTLGMSQSEVAAILGPPSSSSSHITGKQFVPFRSSGRDTTRIVYHYQGLGRVEFSAGSWGQRNGAILCVHDAPEAGER